MADKNEEFPESRRREAFVALIAAQDGGLGVRDSREAIARQFGVDVERVREVEDEGLNKNWPPFGRR